MLSRSGQISDSAKRSFRRFGRSGKTVWRTLALSFVLVSTGSVDMTYAQTPSGDLRSSVQSDAYALIDLIETQFAYSDRFPDGVIPVRRELSPRIQNLSTRNDLIAFSQQACHALYDHHSITGAGLPDEHA